MLKPARVHVPAIRTGRPDLRRDDGRAREVTVRMEIAMAIVRVNMRLNPDRYQARAGAARAHRNRTGPYDLRDWASLDRGSDLPSHRHLPTESIVICSGPGLARLRTTHLIRKIILWTPGG